MNFKFLFLLTLCLLPMASAAQTWNLHFSDGTVTINATDICVEDGTCLTDSAVGDITAINTDGPYLFGGANSGAVSLLFNSSALNLTIDALATGNASFNETYTNTLYATLGAGNASWNETYSDSLYADISVVTDNSSFNQILTDTMYANVNVTSDNSSWSENYAKTIFNQSFNQTLSDTLYILQSEEGNLNVNGTTWWAGVSGWVAGWFQQTGDNLEFNESKLNATIDSRLEVSFFNATYLLNVTGNYSNNLSGTPLQNLTSIQLYDGIFFNLTEYNSDFELLINFTNVTDFSSLIVRHKADIVGNHRASIQLWDYPTARWEGYGFLGETLTSEMQTFGVYDSSDHINNTVVQIRFYQDGTAPFTTHKHMFDWIILSKGFGTPTGTEVDPLSFHINQSINNSGFNISSNYFFGNGSRLLGVNESWTQVFADGLYADVSLVTDNKSWNESYANDLYVNLSGDIMTGDLNMLNNDITNVGNLTLQGYTNGSVLFIDEDGRIAEANDFFYFESNGTEGKLGVGSSSDLRNIFQAVKSEVLTSVENVKALIAVVNTQITNGNWAGISWQTVDTEGDRYSGARIMTEFTNHSEASVSGEMVFDTRHEGTRSEKMRLTSIGNLNMSGGGNISTNYIFGNGTFLNGVNVSWAQTLADTLYGDISLVTDNVSWSESYAITIFNQSWNQTAIDGLYSKYLFGSNNFYGLGNFTTFGSISIGGTNLTQKLVVDSGDITVPGFLGVRLDNDNKFIKIGNPASDVSFISVDNNDILAFGQEDSFLNNGSTFVELMRIERHGGTDDPWVGINTTNPSHTLDLVGDMELTGSLFASSNMTIEKIVFEVNATHTISDNSTCIIIGGSTSRFEIC